MKLYCERCRQQTPHAHTKNWRLCEYCGYSTQLATPPTRPSESPSPSDVVTHNPDVESSRGSSETTENPR